MTLLDPTQNDAGETKAPSKPKAPRRYKILATAEFTNFRPAHERYVTRAGEGSSLRTACTDALDNVLKSDKAKSIRNKTPFKIVFQSGD